MSEDLGSAVLQLKTDDSGFNKGLGSAQKNAAGTFGKMGDSANSSIMGTFKKIALTAGGLFAGAKAIDFFKSSIDAASDLNESISKVKVVFKGAAPAVLAFGKTAATSMGLSNQKALEAVATFGNLFKAMKIGDKPAANMSTSLVKLAGDLASFNNVSPEEALEALRSGVVGETEPLRKFGVNISAVGVQAKALAMGLVKPTKNLGDIKLATGRAELAQSAYTKAVAKHGKASDEAKRAEIALEASQKALAKATKGSVPPLTAAQKAQAAYKLIMEQTKLAQGDFGRTSGGLANQQRILAAQFEDVKAEIGTALMPVMLRFVTLLRDAIVQFKAWWPQIQATSRELAAMVAQGFDKVKPALDNAIGLFKQFISYLNENREALKQIGEAIIVMLGVVATLKVATAIYKAMQAAIFLVRNAQIALNVAMEANPVGLIITAIALLAAGLYLAYQRSATFRNIVNQTFAFLKDTVLPILKQIGQAVINFINDLRSHWDQIKQIFGPVIKVALDVAKQYVNGFVTQIKTIIELFGNVIHGRWGAIWENLKTLVTNPLKTMIGIVKTLITGLGPTLLTLGTAAIGKLLEGLKTVIGKLPGWGASLASGLKGAVADASKWLYQAGRDVVNGLINGITSKAGAAVDAVKGLGSKVIGGALGVFDQSSPSKVFYDMGQMNVQGLVDGIKNSQAKAVQQAKILAGNVIKGAQTQLQSSAGVLTSDLQAAFNAKQGAAQTPAEKELADLQTAHDDAARQDAIDQARQDLLSAQTGTMDPDTGVITKDPAAIIAAQKALDDALYQNRVAYLQTQADAQRTALTNSQTIDQQAFDSQLAALNTYLNSAQVSQEGATARITAFTTQWGIGFASIGGLMGAGFQKGIEDTQADVIKSVKKLAAAIKSALKKGLAIHSPSRWSQNEVGVPLVQGIVKGINREGITVQSALKAIIPRPSVVLGSIKPPAAMPGGGGVTLHQTFNETPASADPTAIGAATSWALRTVAT